MRRFGLLYVVVGLAALSACASPEGMRWQEGVRPKWTLQESDFAPIKPQTTGKQDVERIVGKPFMTSVFPRLGEEVWDYRYMTGVETRVAEVHFDMQGQTKYYTTYKDKCAEGPVGCR